MSNVKNPDGSARELDKDMEEKRQAAFEAMSKKALLINLERKQLANFMFDVQFSNKVREKFGIEAPGMLQVRKCIINPQHFANVRSIINDAMLMLWNHTRPWDNIGFRLLPMDLYDDFNDVFTKIKDEFEEAVQIIVDNWDDYLEEAKRMLGKAWNQADYPSKTALKDMFELKVTAHELPDIDDVRLNITGEEILDIQDAVREKFNMDLSDARGYLKNSIKFQVKLIDSADDKVEVARSTYKALESLGKLNEEATDPEIAAFIEESMVAVKEHYDPEDALKEDKDDGSIGSGLLIDDEEGDEEGDTGLKDYGF